MQIIFWYCRFAKLNPNPMSQKSSYTRYLMIRELFVLITFHKLQKNLLFANINFCKSDKNVYFTYENYAKAYIWRVYNFAKLAKVRLTLDDFCDTEIYSTVIGSFQYSTSSLNIWNSNTRIPSCVKKEKTLKSITFWNKSIYLEFIPHT